MGCITRRFAASAALILCFGAVQSLSAACTSNVISYVVSGTFGVNPVIGADKLKLADEPFTVSLVACDTLIPKKTSPNSASYYPIELRATVKSALVATPFSVPPSSMTLTLISQYNGQDFVQIQGPVNLLGATVNIRGSIALPPGTLTSTSVAQFPSTAIVTAHSAFQYAQGDLSTTLTVFGTASAPIYTPPPPPAISLHREGVESIAAHAGGAQTLRPLPGALDLNTFDQVLLRFYASGVRQAADVRVQIAGAEVPLIYSGPAAHFAGLDEVIFEVPHGLAGAGQVDVVLTADGHSAGSVPIRIQ